jgi:hypothetical protein
MKFRSLIAIGCACIMAACSTTGDSLKDDTTQTLISSKNYRFRAQFAQPLGGVQVNLTSEYTLTVKKDTLDCFLPYFGRAYTATLNPQEGGIKFTTTQFSYEAAVNSKGVYEITLKPLDVRDTRALNLSVLPGGQASLSVTSTNRQAISFTGVVEENKVR